MTTNSKTLVVIAGPTGSGKTDLGIVVAEHFDAPVVSADSRQLYRGMPIGTAQPDPLQLARVRHYFIASHGVDEPFTSGQYEREALELLERLFTTHGVVVAVGGSGLYIDALCGGLDAIPASDPDLRSRLTDRLAESGLSDLLAELQVRDPDYYEKVDRNNPNRVVRALEVCIQTGLPYSSLRRGNTEPRGFDIIKVGTLVERAVLYERIESRVERMMEAGLEEEARKLYPHRELNSLQTVGYRELFDYFDGTITKEEAVNLIKRNTRRYAKRQMTWFGRDESIAWFDPAYPEKVIEYLENKLQSGNFAENKAITNITNHLKST